MPTKMPRFTILGLAAPLALLLTGCGTGGTGDTQAEDASATRQALEDLQQKYDTLVEEQLDGLQEKYESLKENGLDNPTDWAAEDIENIGDWEYRVLDIASSDPTEIESILNEAGNERWEVFWIERSTTGYRVMLKKPSISYLSKLPLSQIGRFVIGGSDSGE